MKKLVAFLFLISLFAGVNAQESDTLLPPLKTKHALGVNFGSTTGVGFAYRYQPSKFGVQVVALPGITSDESILFLGLSGFYEFYESEEISLFGYAGNSLIYTRWDDNSDHSYSVGVGAGLQRRFAEVMTVRFQLGYAIYDVTDRKMMNYIGIRSGIAVEWGMSYHF